MLYFVRSGKLSVSPRDLGDTGISTSTRTGGRPVPVGGAGAGGGARRRFQSVAPTEAPRVKHACGNSIVIRTFGDVRCISLRSLDRGSFIDLFRFAFVDGFDFWIYGTYDIAAIDESDTASYANTAV